MSSLNTCYYTFLYFLCIIDEQVQEEEKHIKRERRSKKKLDKPAVEKKSPKPLNVLLFEREIRSKRTHERVPILKNIKNKGIDESVKEEKEDHVRKTT